MADEYVEFGEKVYRRAAGADGREVLTEVSLEDGVRGLAAQVSSADAGEEGGDPASGEGGLDGGGTADTAVQDEDWEGTYDEESPQYQAMRRDMESMGISLGDDDEAGEAADTDTEAAGAAAAKEEAEKGGEDEGAAQKPRRRPPKRERELQRALDEVSRQLAEAEGSTSRALGQRAADASMAQAVLDKVIGRAEELGIDPEEIAKLRSEAKLEFQPVEQSILGVPLIGQDGAPLPPNHHLRRPDYRAAVGRVASSLAGLQESVEQSPGSEPLPSRYEFLAVANDFPAVILGIENLQYPARTLYSFMSYLRRPIDAARKAAGEHGFTQEDVDFYRTASPRRLAQEFALQEQEWLAQQAAEDHGAARAPAHQAAKKTLPPPKLKTGLPSGGRHAGGAKKSSASDEERARADALQRPGTPESVFAALGL